MGRIFRIVDEAEEYQRGYNQREPDDKMLERAFKEEQHYLLQLL